MNFENVILRREITPDDMERMRIPKRYWNATFDSLSEVDIDGKNEYSIKSFIEKYLYKFDECKNAGAGFIFWGDNGVGKTCGAVVLAKEFRRRYNSVLFIEAANLKSMVANREWFDDTESFWDRAKNVRLLVLDDFGKGIMDSTGFGASLIDELIRSRNSMKLPTIITSNISPDEWIKELDLKKSTMSSISECMLPILVAGRKLRNSNEIKSILGIKN